MTRSLLVAAALSLGGFLSVAAPATALPVAPLAADSALETVAFGCGPGFRPNPVGRCVPAAGRPYFAPGPRAHRPVRAGPRYGRGHRRF